MSSKLICPRCERPFEGHDDKACARKMSRRFFFGVAAGAVAAATIAPEVAKAAAEQSKCGMCWVVQYFTGQIYVPDESGIITGKLVPSVWTAEGEQLGEFRLVKL